MGEVRVVDGIAIVGAAGELDLRTVPPFAASLLASVEAHDRVIADLMDVTFLDSTGLSALVRAATRALERGSRMAVAVGEARVRRVFELTGLVEALGVSESVDSARAFLLRDPSSL